MSEEIGLVTAGIIGAFVGIWRSYPVNKHSGIERLVKIKVYFSLREMMG